MPVDVAAEVISNRRLSGDYNVLALASQAIATSAPGQFVMLKIGARTDPLLRRPFSVFEVLRDPSGALYGFSILNKRIGGTTRLLYAARPSERIACLGPLGRPFSLIERPTEAWMIAGGVGLAPFVTLAESLRARHVGCTLFYGARRADELLYLDFFSGQGVELILATEDGSAGEAGLVTTPFERRLAALPLEQALMIYACGPEAMLRAVARTAGRHHRSCQVSVERIMGCGLGGCYSCVVPMRGEDGGAHYVRSCLAGPVLPADQVVWD
jgi:dihydroorotate dehydrogenase electron transfer subunit